VGGVQAFGLAAMCAIGCSSSSSNACPDVPGSYELTVTPTGQSENNGALCATSIPASVVDVDIADDDASVQGESCRVTATSGCQIQLECEGDSGADATISPTFVQRATFVLPTSRGGATSNALVELGAGYCAFEGSATRE
jgi:hypothetical protein